MRSGHTVRAVIWVVVAVVVVLLPRLQYQMTASNQQATRTQIIVSNPIAASTPIAASACRTAATLLPSSHSASTHIYQRAIIYERMTHRRHTDAEQPFGDRVGVVRPPGQLGRAVAVRQPVVHLEPSNHKSSKHSNSSKLPKRRAGSLTLQQA